MTLTIDLTENADHGYQMKSPDVLIQRIRFDTEPLPGASVIALIKGEQNLRARLMAAGKRTDLPLSGITAGKSTVTVIPLSNVLTPALNPFLVQDNIAAARSLHADCLELRRRIEALQLDLFNFTQEIYEQEQETRLHDTVRLRMEDDVKTHEALLKSKQNEIASYKKLQTRWNQTSAMYGSGSTGYSQTERFTDQLRQQFWSLGFSSAASATTPPTLTKFSNVDVASLTEIGLHTDSPSKTVFDSLKRDAKRAAALDATSIENETIRTDLGMAALTTHEAELTSALGHARDELFLANERWKIKTELWRRRRAQFDDESGLSLRRRLADSLELYAQLSGQLRQALYAIEFGQAVVFGLAIPDFDPTRLNIRNRYIFAPIADGTAPLSGDAVWASLDRLASLLLDAEQRHRKVLQFQRVMQTTETFEGVFQDGQPLKFERDYRDAPLPDPLKSPPPPSRILALRIVNMGDPVSFHIVLEPRGDYGIVPTDDPIYDIVSKFPLTLSYGVVPKTEGGTPAEVPIGEAQYLNRSLNGQMNVTASAAAAGSKNLSLRLEIWRTY